MVGLRAGLCGPLLKRFYKLPNKKEDKREALTSTSESESKDENSEQNQ